MSAQTSFPLAVGVEAQVQTPIGITSYLSFGHTPAAYLEAVAGLLREAGAYAQDNDLLVKDAIENGAWNVRVGLGFTIVEGLELGFGYTYLTASAGLSPGAIEVAAGQPVPITNDVPLSVAMHALSGRIGARFVIERHLVIRAALGWTHTVASQAHIELPTALDPPGGPADQMESAIVQGIGSYGFTPEVLLSVGYRF